MVIQSSHGNGSIGIDLQERESDPQGLGDVKLVVETASEAFGGRASVWVRADALRAFVGQLRQLEAKRLGVATLLSISPGELALRLSSVNARGHMAVTGRLAHHCHSGEAGPYLHAVEFGFEFDPASLPGVLSEFEAWLR
jgi:hypothetical protein